MCGCSIKPVRLSDIGNAQQHYERMMRFLRFQQKMILIWRLMFCAAIVAPFIVIAIFAMGFINA